MNMDNRAVGFRFYPTEEELLCYYLPNKLNGSTMEVDRVIPTLNIYDYNPWELPQFAGEDCPTDSEQWFFFVPMQEREAHGGRRNRLTETGYWKVTGSSSDVYSSQNQSLIGRKNTMVFYEGRAPNGTKTNWKMNEYKVFENHHHRAADPRLIEEFSLCRIYLRSNSTRAFERRPPTAHDQSAVQYYHHLDCSEGVKTVDNQMKAAVESENDWDLATEDELLLDPEVVELLGLRYEEWRKICCNATARDQI